MHKFVSEFKLNTVPRTDSGFYNDHPKILQVARRKLTPKLVAHLVSADVWKDRS